ncbi:hypothetical protein B0H34DRAFT_677849 [Crassisporium funariophilum]|nr:hypothetical protein B0H34DRAFT_677849 [Crassisporium funariophilum]
MLRCSRNITFKLGKSPTKFAEVLYFAVVTLTNNVLEAVAVVLQYGDPHPDLLRMSSNTYMSVKHLRNSGIQVVPAKSIQSVVAMIPDTQSVKYLQDVEGTHLDRWQVVKKPGLKLVERFMDISDLTEEEQFD